MSFICKGAGLLFVRCVNLILVISVILCCSACDVGDKPETYQTENAAAENVIPVSGISDSAEAAILYCPDNKEIIYGHHINEKKPIASITKIMTAVIALEYCRKNDKAVTINEKMYAEGSSMYLKAGEVIKLSEIVKGMMAVSGNDAANAAAISVAGSQEKFLEMMNKKAGELGMSDSHFVTPSGLDSEGHYSTAYDMARLCSYAMEMKEFRDIVSQKSIKVKYISPEEKIQTLYNHNKLLSMCEGCIGIKTGYTRKAGRTLTSCCKRDGVTLIAVTLNDRDDWRDHSQLYSYGFSLLERISLCDEKLEAEVPLTDSDEMVAVLAPEEIPVLTVRRKSRHKITSEVFVPHFIYSPVVKRRIYGRIIFTVDGGREIVCKLAAKGTRKTSGEVNDGKG